MHELTCTFIVTVDVNVQPEDAQPRRTGRENVASITWITLVSETSSASVYCPNSSSSFHLKEKITRMIVWLCERGATMGWGGERQRAAVSSGLRWKEAFGQMTSFQGILHPSISPGHKAPHRSGYQVWELWIGLYTGGLKTTVYTRAVTSVWYTVQNIMLSL